MVGLFTTSIHDGGFAVLELDEPNGKLAKHDTGLQECSCHGDGAVMIRVCVA